MWKYMVVFALCFSVATADEPASAKTSAILFTPPPGWRYADSKSLPPAVKVMVVGKAKKDYPPSINLGMEDFEGTLKDYLKIVKTINEGQSGEWKDLGSIQTEAGKGSLSQLDIRTEWGNVRMMHVILVKDHKAYVLTAAALRDEFSAYYSQFFKTMKSLRFDSVRTDQLATF